jgi:CRP-like cAMP-binding protein
MGIEDDINFLERVPMLRLLGRQALRILAIGAESRDLKPGEALFDAGEAADCGYLIHEGSLRLSSGETVHENIVGVGTLLGEYALITETPRAFTAIAIESSTVLRLSRSLFLKTMEGYPDAARRLRDYLAHRTDQSMKDLNKVKAVLDRSDRWA